MPFSISLPLNSLAAPLHQAQQAHACTQHDHETTMRRLQPLSAARARDARVLLAAIDITHMHATSQVARLRPCCRAAQLRVPRLSTAPPARRRRPPTHSRVHQAIAQLAQVDHLGAGLACRDDGGQSSCRGAGGALGGPARQTATSNSRRCSWRLTIDDFGGGFILGHDIGLQGGRQRRQCREWQAPRHPHHPPHRRRLHTLERDSCSWLSSSLEYSDMVSMLILGMPVLELRDSFEGPGSDLFAGFPAASITFLNPRHRDVHLGCSRGLPRCSLPPPIRVGPARRLLGSSEPGCRCGRCFRCVGSRGGEGSALAAVAAAATAAAASPCHCLVGCSPADLPACPVPACRASCWS